MTEQAGHRRPIRLAVIGSTMVDQIAYIERVPAAGETIVGERYQMGFGGKGANQAVMARRFGAEVAMINCVGDDMHGRLTRDNFETLGIDTTYVRTTDGASGVAPIWVEPDGTNRIIIIPGANLRVTPELAVEAVSALTPLDVVVGQFEIPQAATAAGFRAARAVGSTTVLNPAPADAIDPELLTVTDWLIPNEVEFAALADGADPDDDAALQRFADRTATRLLVTRGPGGVTLVDHNKRVVRMPAPTVDAVDTTGAGDAFVGSFAIGLASDVSELLAAELGLRCASDSVTREGTQSSFTDPARCQELLAELERDHDPSTSQA